MSRVLAFTDEVDGRDITEAVQILYDIVHQSMDWGSGMLSNEEMETVIRLAVLMGWKVPDLPGNSPAIGTVALKFPDHYEVEQVVREPTRTSTGYIYPGYVNYKVKRKGS